MLAYIRSNTPPHRLHIPISNIPRPDLDLRVELAAVLRHAGLQVQDLLTLSELPDVAPEATRWLLVDHNSLTGPLGKFSAQVEGCVDHHVDEGAVGAQAETRVIEPCGSCMSLVVEQSRLAWEAMSKLPLKDHDAEPAVEDDRLARIALGPILIDTVNLTAEAKIRDKDRSAVKFLDSKIHDQAFDKDKFYDEVSALKEDISSLSLNGIFRKDYKEWHEADLKLGISSIPQNLAYLLSHAAGADTFVDELSKWAAQRQLDIAGVMTASHPDGVFQRDLLLWGLSEGGVEVVRRFGAGKGGELQLETWEDGKLDDGEKRRVWRQMELKASRKKVAPFLREVMKETA